MNYLRYRRAFQKISRISLWILLFVIILSNFIWAFRDIVSRDFGSFVASGRAASLHLNPYRSDELGVFIIDLPKIEMHVKAVNLNPPILLPFFELLGSIEESLAFRIWQIFSICMYLLGLWILIKFSGKSKNLFLIIWAIGLAGFWHSIELGQIYIPLVTISIIIWVLIKKNHLITAGVLLGILVAIKPNFIIWAIFIAACGYITVSITALIAFVILWVLPVMRYGLLIYPQWFWAMQEFDGYALPANNSFIGLTSRFGSNSIGMIVGIVLIIASFILILIKKPNWAVTSGLAIVLSLLTSPTAWSGYTLFLLPLFFCRKWTFSWKIIAAILAVPFPLVFSLTQFNSVFFVLFGWFYGWGVLILLVVLIKEIYSNNRENNITSEFSNIT